MRVAADVPLAPLTTLRLGGPARRLVEARPRTSSSRRCAATRRRAAALLAGGSNVVIADAGLPGTVVRVRDARASRATGGDRARTAQAGEPWDDARRALRGGRARRRRVPVRASRARPARRRSRTSAPTARRSPRRSCRVRVLDRAHGERRRARAASSAASATARARFKRDPDRCVVLEVDLRARAHALGEPDPLRRARARARRARSASARRSPTVREAVLALRRGKGMVLDPADPDTVSAGSFFTNPILDRRAFAALAAPRGRRARPPAFPDADGRVKTSAAWLIERAGFTTGYGDGRASPSRPSTRSRSPTAAARTTGELLALAREIADGVRSALRRRARARADDRGRPLMRFLFARM